MNSSQHNCCMQEYGLEDVRDAPSLIQPVHDSQDLHEDDGEAEAAYDKVSPMLQHTDASAADPN